MPVIAMPSPLPRKEAISTPCLFGAGVVDEEPIARTRPRLSRPGSLLQGRALEMLGHAVEYLVDSRMFGTDEAGVRSDGEAVQILMRMSRAVFAECPEVVPLRQRFGRWFAGIEKSNGRSDHRR